MGITLDLYDGASPTTHLGPLAKARDRGWQHDYNRPGAGKATMNRDNPAVLAGWVRSGNIVRCTLDGVPRFAWLIEDERQTTKSVQGEGALLRSVSGRGVLALLERAKLLPQAGVDRLACDRRTFGWQNPSYDPAANGWTAAVEIKRQATGPPNQWTYTDDEGAIKQAPVGWYDPDAYWIWSRAQGPLGNPLVPPQPVGSSLFATAFILTEQTPVAFMVTADDGFELWVNGCLVAMETTAFMWAETRRYDVLLPAGNVYVRIKGTTIVREHVDTNIAGVLMSAYAVGEGGATVGSVLCRTDSSWFALDYPVGTVGMTPGHVLIIAVAEAQARHASLLGGVTWDFTDLVDSNGVPWAVQLDLSFLTPESNVLQVVETLVEQCIDVEMTPTLVLRAFNKGTLGGPVAVTYDGTNITGELEHQRQRVVTNAVVVRKSDGYITEVVDGPSIAAHGRYEGSLTLGTANSDEAAANAVDEILSEWGEVLVGVGFTITPKVGIMPYTAVVPGDTVQVPDMDTATPTDTLLTTLTVADAADNAQGDPAGTVTYRWSGYQVGA